MGNVMRLAQMAPSGCETGLLKETMASGLSIRNPNLHAADTEMWQGSKSYEQKYFLENPGYSPKLLRWLVSSSLSSLVIIRAANVRRQVLMRADPRTRLARDSLREQVTPPYPFYCEVGKRWDWGARNVEYSILKDKGVIWALVISR
ncbi:hypothetical protein NDU88_000884 [Pleurodeles waltl]|uniref:Uncharacterized protein n=1 Tax=Pleurodeles waltl TaxID=8319 RepID=A0AAV7S880_PLEWA|nr:hypothetical protein NDU88_000884 [Pleurodeles waltl]